MLRMLLLLSICLPLHLVAQQTDMEGGKILDGDKLYARYEVLGDKKPVLASNYGMYERNPEANPEGFKDYIFSTPDGEQLVFAVAKVLASPYRTGVQYYYSIQFATNEESLNICYHPLTIRSLAKDLVKYHVLKDGKADNESLLRLIAAWRKNKMTVDEKMLRLSSIRYYNNSVYHVDDLKHTQGVTVHDHNIYYKDSLVATYNLSKHLSNGTLPGTSKEDFYYFINYPDGKPLAEMQFQVYKSSLYIWPSPLKDPFKVYTAERGEEGLIKVAGAFLLNRQQELARANNK